MAVPEIMFSSFCWKSAVRSFLNLLTPVIAQTIALYNIYSIKGPVKREKIAHSIHFTVCVKFVPLYHFKLAYVNLHMAVAELFETQF